MGGEEIRVVFMGTPAFAVPSLEALLALGTVDGVPFQLVAAYTQPDRPAGRGNRVAPSPVKEAALAAGLRVEQPERLRRPEPLATLAALAPDLIVVAAYAQILSQRVLDLPRLGCLNVHASLLPRYRGAAPIQAALLAGDAESGVCIMGMEAGLDTGPVLDCYREPIRGGDTAASLAERLAVGGAALLARTVPAWVRGEIVPVPQDEALSTMTRPLRKEDGRVAWQAPAAVIERQVRAMYPWPGAWTLMEGTLIKILEVACVLDGGEGQAAGTLLPDRQGGDPVVVTGAGLLALVRVQPAGKRAMSGAEWLRGMPGARGQVLGGDSLLSAKSDRSSDARGVYGQPLGDREAT